MGEYGEGEGVEKLKNWGQQWKILEPAKKLAYKNQAGEERVKLKMGEQGEDVEKMTNTMLTPFIIR